MGGTDGRAGEDGRGLPQLQSLLHTFQQAPATGRPAVYQASAAQNNGGEGTGVGASPRKLFLKDRRRGKKASDTFFQAATLLMINRAILWFHLAVVFKSKEIWE